MELPNQAKFHPLKYLSKLSDVLHKNGVEIFEETLINKIDANENGVIVTAENENTITADYAVMATHITLGGPLLVQTELVPYNTYVICVEIQNKTLSENLYWDTNNPYNYIRVDKSENGNTILILGGADHKTGEEINNADEKYNQLENYLRNILPDAKYKILLKWSGQVIESIDGLPYIGFLPEKKNTLIATGFAGAGMTLGTISAQIITDLINQKENGLTNLYPVTRVKGVNNFIKKNSEVLKQYYRKYFGKFEKMDAYNLEPNQGKVCEQNGKKIAVYKSPDGKVTKLSAVCTHMECIVKLERRPKILGLPLATEVDS